MSLKSRKILTFDVVGTLVDFETGVVNYIRSVAGIDGEVLKESQILECFAAIEDRLHIETPGRNFTSMLPDIYRAMAQDLNLLTSEEAVAGLRLSMADWPAFPDSIQAMKALRKRYYLVAMTNADNWALEQFSNTLEHPFDDKVTAEDAETCKPDPQVFGYVRGLMAHKGYTMDDYVHVAQSQFHDIVIAKQLGYQVAWIERRKDKDGYGGSPSVSEAAKPDYHVASMAEFVALAESES